MRELLIRTLSGMVISAVIVFSVLFSPLVFSALMLLLVAVGTIEMARLQSIKANGLIIIGELIALSFFAVSALVSLEVLSVDFLFVNLLVPFLPFMVSLFSKRYDFRHISSFILCSLLFLALPCSVMISLFRHDLFGDISGAPLLLMVFAMIWMNDIFAFLTGRLFGKHKLFSRVSPGKTIEGSLGGLLFTIVAVCIFNHYVSWLSLPAAIGLSLIAVVFGSLGDLCESMLKRQAGVKDSGRLIPGHGGILDRFDSVLFSVPFIFVYLLLI